jgi:hypothetical protein
MIRLVKVCLTVVNFAMVGLAWLMWIYHKFKQYLILSSIS